MLGLTKKINSSRRSFFNRDYVEAVASPNGNYWWHSPPLPERRRIKGAHKDLSRQFKMWEAMQIDPAELASKHVLDIGANDGFFSVAAALSGAKVVAIDAHWSTWPDNISYLAEQWGATLTTVTDDVRTHNFDRMFDTVFCLGVIYHVEDVFAFMKKLADITAPGGTIYLETHLTDIESDRPIWEAASDLYPTSAPQGKAGLGMVGIANFLLPNTHALIALAHTFDMECTPLLDNDYCREDSTRGMFRLQR